MDAIFGFSFHSQPRPPFDEPIRLFKETSIPIVSVDIPSGWNVETGNPDDSYFTPDVLVSLTAPKLGSKSFNRRHFLGGRFVPPLVHLSIFTMIFFLKKSVLLFCFLSYLRQLLFFQRNYTVIQVGTPILSRPGKNNFITF